MIDPARLRSDRGEGKRGGRATFEEGGDALLTTLLESPSSLPTFPPMAKGRVEPRRIDLLLVT
jgi:hypothetical protein